MEIKFEIKKSENPREDIEGGGGGRLNPAW